MSSRAGSICFFGVMLCALMAACNGSDEVGGGGAGPPPATSNSLRLQTVTAVLSSPVFLTAPTGDVGRLFIVEQGGLIRILNSLDGTPRATPFLDVAGLIVTGGEQGLLGMAFDPNYAGNGRFYIYYTNTAGDIVIARYGVSTNPDIANAGAQAILKTIAHPTNQNHNGGMLAFGPDGCLYAGIGDGGGSGDPNGNAQNTNSLLGKILRLDPETGSACGTDNPFANGTGGAPEVWSFGLRNPWRFSFDRSTGVLYIGDVGQDQREEVDAVVGPNAGQGVNFGWNIMEGFACFNPPSGCNSSGLTPPILDYSHDAGACSVTGGYVYRGTLNPAVNGSYFYADYCAGFVRSFQLQGGRPSSQNTWPLLSPGGQITSFGEDARGELYILTQTGGLSRIVAN
ncbi:MAG TPA: PQQ-dependent sugar dehydrogenase [Nitrospira sp.]|nr:PQQ-dependent sugar dehydrogenase [Nitrospira sp.]